VAEVPPLVGEATKKSDLVWLSVDGQPRAYPVWQLWHDAAAYVVSGDGEQPAPGLADAVWCTVTVRSKDNGGRIVSWQAAVERLEPDGEDWREVVPALLAARLNLPDVGTAERRWAESATVLRLSPTGEQVESGAELPVSSGAAPPPPSPARSRTRIPFTVGRRRR
jgi:hypothetical protein